MSECDFENTEENISLCSSSVAAFDEFHCKNKLAIDKGYAKIGDFRASEYTYLNKEIVILEYNPPETSGFL